VSDEVGRGGEDGERSRDPARDPRPWRPGWGGPPWLAGPGVDVEARELWRHRAWARRGRGRPPRRAFGCFFGAAFVVVGSAFVVVASVLLSAVGMLGGGSPPPLTQLAAFIVLAAGVVAIGLAGRWFRRAARTLDDLVAAAARVEDGDYGVRVAMRRGGPRPLRDLVHGFNTMVERLAADERQRRSLLADVSHELRTPLSVVQGSLEAIADGVHPPDAAHLAAILDETRTVARLVDDLRTVALAETGSLPLHREATDLAALVADVAASFRASAAAAGITLAIDAAETLPLLEVDPVRVREVLTNLVANAIRHTPAGGLVRIAAQAWNAAGAMDGIRLAVEDTGTGIDPADLPHVFDRFWKDPASRGSGLGLAIARNLVRAHGGEIRAESEPGRGTTVWFTLPASGA
jgi:signal transduction histidine kinase